MTKIVKSEDALRRTVAIWRQDGDTVALVPTMGALHDGHLALIAGARQRAARTIVSIFVNPTQFAPHEDFDRYPRPLDDDVAKLRKLGVDLVYVPTAADMYQPGFATSIAVAGPALRLETDFRPHFFAGVALVVAKLFLRARPDFAIFGEKDYQQLLVVRRMAADLDIPVEVIGLPTVREADGLALSSRNAYLSTEERSAAPTLHRALSAAAAAIRTGADPRAAVAEASREIDSAGFKVDYVAARNAETLADLERPGEPIRLLVAAWLGKTRLIDNIGV